MGRIRTRLIVALVVVALLPAIPLTFLVRNLLERSFATPFASDVERALEAGVVESRSRLRAEKDAFRAELEERLAPELRTGLLLDSPDPSQWMLDERDGGVVLVLPTVEGVTESAGAIERWGVRAHEENPTAEIHGPERLDDLLVAGIPVPDGQLAVVARPLPEGMAERANRMTETIGLLQAFRSERSALLRGYVVPFLLTYGLLVVVAIGVGTVLASRIAQPVEALARGAARVGAGDLDLRVTAPASGEVGHLVSEFNRMVEDLAAQRDELTRLERVAAWRDLARSLAHEIKNPLTPIQLAVQQLGDRYPVDAQDPEYGALLTECVEIVNEEVAALRRLVKEFSEFARLPEPQPEWGSLASTIVELGRLYGAERMTWDVDGKLRARFDESEMKRALINLIDNGMAACRSANNSEFVEVSAEQRGEEMHIRVTDRGCGIPEENRPRVFEPNFSTKSEGMGLGLAIVEGIVRGHGGSIEVESEVDRGTTFRIRFPVEGPGPKSQKETA